MDKEIRKKVLRLITYGLYVITARYEDEISAGTVNFLSQCSFEPPLVMVAIKRDSRLHSIIEKSRKFAVNILKEGQKDIAAKFFGKTQVEGNKINGFSFEYGEKSGAPLILEIPAYFECDVVSIIKEGDHSVIIAKVVNAFLREEVKKPLIMFETGWYYGG